MTEPAEANEAKEANAFWTACLESLSLGRPLDEARYERLFTMLMQGSASPVQASAFLMGLCRLDDPLVAMRQGVRVLRASMRPPPSLPAAVTDSAIDIVGTGGDGWRTYNISTSAAFLVAGAGVYVTKHGNRAFSSVSGTADVLEELGLDLAPSPGALARGLEAARFGFFLAPHYHGSMRHIASVRRELGFRTLFNLLGPLCNPSRPRFLLIGCAVPERLAAMAQLAGENGAEHVWVVYGADGLDELSVTGPNQIVAWSGGRTTSFWLDPQELGLPRAKPEALIGGEAASNAGALEDLLVGRTVPPAYRDTVLLNAGAALHIAGAASSVGAGLARARTALEDGSGLRCLEAMRRLTPVSERA